MRYQETGELHLDFHGATNTTIDYIVENYGPEAMQEIFFKVGHDVYKSIRENLQQGDKTELLQHWRHFFDREGCDYTIEEDGETVTLTIKECPAVKHIRKLGLKLSPNFCDQTNYVNKGLCDRTGYTIDTVKTGEGSCIQTLRKIN